jgi:hypothetical protein
VFHVFVSSENQAAMFTLWMVNSVHTQTCPLFAVKIEKSSLHYSLYSVICRSFSQSELRIEMNRMIMTVNYNDIRFNFRNSGEDSFWEGERVNFDKKHNCYVWQSPNFGDFNKRSFPGPYSHVPTVCRYMYGLYIVYSVELFSCNHL